MIKKLFFGLVLSSLVYANNDFTSIVEDYRLNGQKNIISKLDTVLQSREYWEEHLKDKEIEYGYYENIKDILVCDKSRPNFFHYVNNNFKIEKKSNIDAIVGKIKGDKQKEGDLKTPVGTYDLVQRLDTVDQFYGPLAFVTSYPNMYDKLQGKDGHGIWIHGLPLQESREDESNTKGCIAVKNDYLTQLSKDIDFKKSVLIVSEDGYEKVTKDEMVTVLSQLYKWRWAWKESNIEDYLSFYDEKFIRWDGKNLKQFSSMKRSIFARKSPKTIIFYDFSIAPYPSTDGTRMFRVKFKENYISTRHKFQGNKELYIKLVDNKIKILAEQ
jgi:murein L,D-transpeptidase YafK